MKDSISSLRSVILAAVIGGLVVAVLGFAAISAGLVGKNETVTRTITTGATDGTKVSNNGNGEGLVSQIYERDGSGVGFITSTGVSSGSSPFDPYGQSEEGTATGSGFFIDSDGHMVTNNHVIEGAKSVTVTLGGDRDVYDAEVVGNDPSTDLAVLKVDAPDDAIQPLTLGDSNKMKVGDPVVAIGNPFGLDRTVTTGIVSALQREIQSTTNYAISNVIQTDAAINPGNSGGPLINADSDVIGVNSQIATGASGGGNVGIGFAVPSSTVKNVVDQIKETGKVEHAYLGISAATVTPSIADALNLGVDHGALVQEAPAGGPAAKAGIKTGKTEVEVEGQKVIAGGDVIIEADGEEISSMDELVSMVNEAAVGDQMDLVVSRNGKTSDIKITLGSRPEPKDQSAQSAGPAEEGDGGGETPHGESPHGESPHGEQPMLPPGFGQ